MLQRHHVNSREESKIFDDWEKNTLSHAQGSRILGACIVATSLLNMGNGSKTLMRMLIGEMKSAIDEQKVSEGKVKPVDGTQTHFICATTECEGKLSEAARARQRCDSRFKPRVCTECYFKDAGTVRTAVGENGWSTMPPHPRSVGRNSSVPIVLQVSTVAPEQKRKAERKNAKKVRKEKTGIRDANLARQPVVRSVTFSIAVNPNGSDDVASGENSTLSAQFESLEDEGKADDADSSDGSGSSTNLSAEEGEDMEGDSAGDVGSGKRDGASGWATSDGSASCTSSSNNDDDQSDNVPYLLKDYVDALGRLRAHLTTQMGDGVLSGALSVVLAKLDGFEDELADPEGDSPCGIFAFIGTALFETGDGEGAEMAMRAGIETRREGDNFDCHSSLAYLMAARGDITEAERVLLEGAATEEKEGDGGEECLEHLDDIKERYGDTSSLNQTCSRNSSTPQADAPGGGCCCAKECAHASAAPGAPPPPEYSCAHPPPGWRQACSAGGPRKSSAHAEEAREAKPRSAGAPSMRREASSASTWRSAKCSPPCANIWRARMPLRSRMRCCAASERESEQETDSKAQPVAPCPLAKSPARAEAQARAARRSGCWRRRSAGSQRARPAERHRAPPHGRAQRRRSRAGTRRSAHGPRLRRRREQLAESESGARCQSCDADKRSCERGTCEGALLSEGSCLELSGVCAAVALAQS